MNELKSKTDEPTWPPEPNVPIAHRDYDEFLTSVLFERRKWSLVKREDLELALRRVWKLDYDQRHAVVNDYCDRYQIFQDGFRPWLRVILIWLIPFIAFLFVDGVGHLAKTEMAQHAVAAREVWNATKMLMSHYSFVNIVLTPILFGWVLRRELARQADEARAKVRKALGTSDG